jgi:cystathionine beta-synthase
MSILESIGHTPLVKLLFDIKPTILAKLEYFNPGGSIKDRAALFMVEEAEKQGLLKPGGTIVEATSGNQGIALAMIGAVKGYDVIITVPDRTSAEKISTLQAYGAKVYVCPNADSLDDPDGYHAKAEELYHKIPGAFMPNQYYNVANLRAHYLTTGPEIWEQTDGKVTHCFVAMGTCGTISGVGRYLKERKPEVKIIGIDAATSKFSSPDCPKAYKSEGIGVDVVSDILDLSVIDEVVPIEDLDVFNMTRELAKKGLLVGLSSGAVMHVALKHAETLNEDDIVVVIFADSGRSYLSKVFHV